MNLEPIAVAVFAKAPVSGFAKTRLVPALGAEGAAALQAALTERALATAVAAGTGPVTLWGAPDAAHPALVAVAQRHGATLAAQPEGDLGTRMLAAFAGARDPLILIGTDCPCLTPDDLRDAANLLRTGSDVVMAPAEDGGYGLIGARGAVPALFEAMPWSTERVAALTRERARGAGLRLAALRTVWDVDRPADLDRLRRERLMEERPRPKRD